MYRINNTILDSSFYSSSVKKFRTCRLTPNLLSNTVTAAVIVLLMQFIKVACVETLNFRHGCRCYGIH